MYIVETVVFSTNTLSSSLRDIFSIYVVKHGHHKQTLNKISQPTCCIPVHDHTPFFQRYYHALTRCHWALGNSELHTRTRTHTLYATSKKSSSQNGVWSEHLSLISSLPVLQRQTTVDTVRPRVAKWHGHMTAGCIIIVVVTIRPTSSWPIWLAANSSSNLVSDHHLYTCQQTEGEEGGSSSTCHVSASSSQASVQTHTYRDLVLLGHEPEKWVTRSKENLKV